MQNKRGIVPRKIKGFRDIDPNLNQLKWKIINAASKVYKLYGFEHWDTPIIEYADNLGNIFQILILLKKVFTHSEIRRKKQYWILKGMTLKMIGQG